MTRYLRAVVCLLIVTFALSIIPIGFTQPVPVASSTIVISEFRVRGPKGGNDEFIELTNISSTLVDISGWKIRGSNSSGTVGDRVTITAGITIQPGCSYLLTNASTTSGPYSGTIAGDQTYLTGVGDDGGLALTLPDNTVIDQVGMSAGSAFKEGTQLTNLGSSNLDRGYERKRDAATGIFVDTDDNSADFQLKTPSDPQNNDLCETPPPPATPLNINEIQGNSLESPHINKKVKTTGIVTARKNNGFFLQTLDANVDSDMNTSEAVFIFTSAPPSALVGDLVTVEGIVVEYFKLTEISTTNSVVTVISTGNALPAPIELTSSILDSAGTLTQLERLEGMRVSAPSFVSVAPTNEFGEIDTVLSGVARPFREPGVSVASTLPPGPPNIPRFDENPEKLMIDSDGQIDSTRSVVTSGVTLTGITGPLDFTFSNYKILPDTTLTASTNMIAVPVPVPTSNEFSVGSFNLLNFFPSDSNLALRMNKISLAIRNVMNSPAIIGVEEAGDIDVLTALADKINADATTETGVNPGYKAYLLEGIDNAENDQDVGFLVKSSIVDVVSVSQHFKGVTFTDPTQGDEDLLFDRPPFELKGIVKSAAGNNFPVTIIVNHSQSLIDIDSPTRGTRQRLKRKLQSEYVANLAQSKSGENLILVGDFNSFQFSDGYVDVLGTIIGKPAPADQVVLASEDLVNPDLIPLVNTLPADQQYSYNHLGNAQTLDHIIINSMMNERFSRFVYARNNADFPETYSVDGTRPERVSDHDIPVAYFSFPTPVVDLTISVTDSPDPVIAGGAVTYTINVTNNGSDTALNVNIVDVVSSNIDVTSCNCNGFGGFRFATFPAVAPGETKTITVEGTVNIRIRNNTIIPNLAVVSSTTKDTNVMNNWVITTTTANKK